MVWVAGVGPALNGGSVRGNVVGALSLIEHEGRVAGGEVRDAETNECWHLHASATVVAAGPWTSTSLDPASPNLTLVKGQPLVWRAIPGGQTPFLPSSHIKYGVDFAGNGHGDLRHSVPDVLASTANLLKVNGWRAGQPYREGSENFQVMREWNRSEIYRKTIVLMAQRIGGQ